jgi:hypothetical protein
MRFISWRVENIEEADALTHFAPKGVRALWRGAVMKAAN